MQSFALRANTAHWHPPFLAGAKGNQEDTCLGLSPCVFHWERTSGLGHFIPWEVDRSKEGESHGCLQLGQEEEKGEHPSTAWHLLLLS